MVEVVDLRWGELSKEWMGRLVRAIRGRDINMEMIIEVSHHMGSDRMVDMITETAGRRGVKKGNSSNMHPMQGIRMRLRFRCKLLRGHSVQ